MNKYEVMDSMICFHYKNDLYEEVNKRNFTYVSEYVEDAYYNRGLGHRPIAKEIGKSHSAVLNWLNIWNFILKNPGGPNHVKQQV